MKKQLLTSASILMFGLFANAQNNNANPSATGANWKSNGNSAATSDFIGTTNAQDLIFKTNNQERLLLDQNGNLILKDRINPGNGGGGEIIISPGLLHRAIPTNPIAAYMLKVGGSGIFEGEVNARQLFVEEYITFMKSLKGPRIDVDSIKMDSTRGIYGHTKIFGNVDIKQDLTVDGDATFNNTLTAKKGVMFDEANGIRYTAPTATTPAKYNLGGGTYQPLSTACPLPDQNYGWFATQGAYISHVSPNTLGAPSLINASLTMMTAPWDGNGIIEVAGTDKNGGTSNGLLINYFCGRSVEICTGANKGRVTVGDQLQANKNVRIGNFGTDPFDPNISLSIAQNNPNTTALKLNVYEGTVKAIDLVNPGNQISNFTVFQSGKTQIGYLKQTAPQHADAMLTVSGKIVAQSCYVKITNWADYVFADNYKLPNLYDIEKFYLANKHLPEIPSEKEIIENGVDVAEMNKLLLQKIEELTIMMVKQQKEIDALKLKTK